MMQTANHKSRAMQFNLSAFLIMSSRILGEESKYGLIARPLCLSNPLMIELYNALILHSVNSKIPRDRICGI
jgi:hypothetical protein